MWKPQDLDNNTFRIGFIVALVIVLAALPSQYRPQLAGEKPPLIIAYTDPASDFVCATRDPAYDLAEFMDGVKRPRPKAQRIPSAYAYGACPEGAELLALPRQ